jgi:hypothetical protein
VGDGVCFPWGATVAEVTPPFARTETRVGQRWHAPCPSILGVPTLYATLQEPPVPALPVEGLAYEIAAWRGLDPHGVFNRLTEALGVPSDVSRVRRPRGSEDEISEYWSWKWNLASLSVSIYGAPRAVHGGIESLGCLNHTASKTQQLAWATKLWRARGAEDPGWATEEAGCEAHAFEVQSVYPAPSDEALEPARAREAAILSTRYFDRGFAAATPAWIASRLPQPPDGAVVWFHPAAQKWGISTSAQTAVLDVGYIPALKHERISAARGPGGAAVGTLHGPSFVSTQGALDALDALVAFLVARLGCAVTVDEYNDV